MDLTQAEIERYAPYHTFPEFERGYWEYPSLRELDGVAGQAYDRGAELSDAAFNSSFQATDCVMRLGRRYVDAPAASSESGKRPRTMR
jgi:hypothetical protein